MLTETEIDYLKLSPYNTITKQVGKCTVLIGIHPQGWHLSISHENINKQPSYREIKEAMYKFIPDDVTMAMIFPLSKEWVNVKDNCYHLFQIPND